MSTARKLEWQRNQRREFAQKNGYSTASHYATAGIRKQVLERDGYKCVKCGMTDAQHKAEWNRPITVDHKNKNRKENAPSNLQTLCLRCHGQKDLIARLRVQRVPEHRSAIMCFRAGGLGYQAIADGLGFSVASIWKWVKRWEKETA